MPVHETEAFVLRTYTLAEAHKICVFLTRGQGKVRAAAHGARKMKSRFGSSLEPFTEVALCYHQKEGRDLASVSSCEILKSHFHRAARDVQTATAFSYMAELLIEFMPEHEQNERLYRLVAATMEAIEASHDMTGLLRYFEVWLLRLAGFFPDVSRCAVCQESIPVDAPVFLSVDGTPRCFNCGEGLGTALGPDLRQTILHMLKVGPGAIDQVSALSAWSRELGDINYRLVRHALERDLRSFQLLMSFGPAEKISV